MLTQEGHSSLPRKFRCRLEPEQAGLESAWAAHFEMCAPTKCTYDVAETVLDSLLKTVALASPLLSATMAGAALFYTKLHEKSKEGGTSVRELDPAGLKAASVP